MHVLECCVGCGSKVESNHCCGKGMEVHGQKLSCPSCKKEVEVNMCCGKHMKEKKM